MELWMILTAVGLAAAAAGAVAVAVWVLLRRSDRRIAAYQNKLLARQIAEVENLYLTMRGWRHDYHNHLQTLKARLDMGQTAGAREYLDHLEDDLDGIRAVGGLLSLSPQILLALKKRVRRGFCSHIETPSPKGNEIVHSCHCQQHQQDTPVQPNRGSPIEYHPDKV